MTQPSTPTNPRLEAMRAEALRLRAGYGPEVGSMRELGRAGRLEACLRAYGSDAELEAAEAEARRCRGATAAELEAMRGDR